MTITQDQAADALRDIETAEIRGRELKRYEECGPVMMMWGVIWMIGYGVTGWQPRFWIIWIPLTMSGIAASMLYRQWLLSNDPSAARGVQGRKWSLMAGVIAAFIGAAYAVMQPNHANAYAAFPALVVALAYGMVGIWLLPRFLFLGAGVFVLTMAGFLAAAPWFNAWMAAVGGGALVLGGVWLRKL